MLREVIGRTRGPRAVSVHKRRERDNDRRLHGRAGRDAHGGNEAQTIAVEEEDPEK